MKKLSAILLAILLVLSLSVTAFADEAAAGTITVNGAENGETYTLYKIFDITTVNGAPAYSIPSGRNYSTTEKFGDLFETTTASVDGTDVTYVTRKASASDADIIAWAKANTASFGNVAATEVAAEGKVEFIGLGQGYYYVSSPVSNGAAAMIADTTQTATVVEKNSAPGWDDGDKEGGKKADGETYYAGDTITYTLTYYNAVNYDQGKKVAKYFIEDTLPEGIAYTDNLIVKINDTAVTPTIEDGTIENGFKVSIPWVDEDGNSLYTTNPSVITVTYTAVMGNTKIAEGITNVARIYPNTNDNPGEETEEKDTVYTGQIVLTKVDNKEESILLSGAKFKVKTADGKYLKQDGDKFAEVDEAGATVFVTDAEGKITLSGLKEGTYTFVEIEAPAGYNLPADPALASVELKLTKDTSGNVTGVASMSQTQQVNNSKAANMPETGGMGTTLFYIVGGLMAAGAAILLITQKRMRAAR